MHRKRIGALAALQDGLRDHVVGEGVHLWPWCGAAGAGERSDNSDRVVARRSGGAADAVAVAGSVWSDPTSVFALWPLGGTMRAMRVTAVATGRLSSGASLISH